MNSPALTLLQQRPASHIPAFAKRSPLLMASAENKSSADLRTSTRSQPDSSRLLPEDAGHHPDRVFELDRIGGCRRELLDRTLIWNQHHLRRILHQYETHHNQHRPHRSLDAAAPLKPLPNRSIFSSTAYEDRLAPVARSTNIAWSRDVDKVFGTHSTCRLTAGREDLNTGTCECCPGAIRTSSQPGHPDVRATADDRIPAQRRPRPCRMVSACPVAANLPRRGESPPTPSRQDSPPVQRAPRSRPARVPLTANPCGSLPASHVQNDGQVTVRRSWNPSRRISNHTLTWHFESGLHVWL
jgi:hypothetical protein